MPHTYGRGRQLRQDPDLRNRFSYGDPALGRQAQMPMMGEMALPEPPPPSGVRHFPDPEGPGGGAFPVDPLTGRGGRHQVPEMSPVGPKPKWSESPGAQRFLQGMRDFSTIYASTYAPARAGIQQVMQNRRQQRGFAEDRRQMEEQRARMAEVEQKKAAAERKQQEIEMGRRLAWTTKDPSQLSAHDPERNSIIDAVTANQDQAEDILAAVAGQAPREQEPFEFGLTAPPGIEDPEGRHFVPGKGYLPIPGYGKTQAAPKPRTSFGPIQDLENEIFELEKDRKVLRNWLSQGMAGDPQVRFETVPWDPEEKMLDYGTRDETLEEARSRLNEINNEIQLKENQLGRYKDTGDVEPFTGHEGIPRISGITPENVKEMTPPPQEGDSIDTYSDRLVAMDFPHDIAAMAAEAWGIDDPAGRVEP